MDFFLKTIKLQALKLQEEKWKSKGSKKVKEEK